MTVQPVRRESVTLARLFPLFLISLTVFRATIIYSVCHVATNHDWNRSVLFMRASSEAACGCITWISLLTPLLQMWLALGRCCWCPCMMVTKQIRKRCPFCGGSMPIIEDDADNQYYCWIYRCEDCAYVALFAGELEKDNHTTCQAT